MATFVVEYVYDPHGGERMDDLRPAHRAFLGGLVDQGVIKVFGPSPSPEGAPGAYVIMEARSVSEAFELLEDDPFFVNDLITERIARELTIVGGGFSS